MNPTLQIKILLFSEPLSKAGLTKIVLKSNPIPTRSNTIFIFHLENYLQTRWLTVNLQVFCNILLYLFIFGKASGHCHANRGGSVGLE